jgi:hypothetical protein
MFDDKTVQRFIDLRARGWSFARLMTETTTRSRTGRGENRETLPSPKTFLVKKRGFGCSIKDLRQAGKEKGKAFDSPPSRRREGLSGLQRDR